MTVPVFVPGEVLDVALVAHSAELGRGIATLCCHPADSVL